MDEWDISRDPSHDLLNSDVASQILQDVQSQAPFVVICTPPCNTFSWARRNWERSPGPRPIRDATYPLGYPWLSDANRRLADKANFLVGFMWDTFKICIALCVFFLGEHPEDLGVTPAGRPASIWQMAEFSECLQAKGVCTFAIYQCMFGASTSKPTRWITNLEPFAGPIFRGTPTFDKSGHYTGPLPFRCPHQHDPLIGKSEIGEWRTSPAAAYPPQLCETIANSIFSSFNQTSASGGNSCGAGLNSGPDRNEDIQLDTLVERAADTWLDEQTPEIVTQQTQTTHWSKLQSGCSGPPLRASLHGRAEALVDGFGLCSPGNWSPKVGGASLGFPAQAFAAQLRELLDDFCKT